MKIFLSVLLVDSMLTAFILRNSTKALISYIREHYGDKITSEDIYKLTVKEIKKVFKL